MPAVLFFGGNGHCASRLASVRAVLDRLGPAAPFELTDLPYPGFEDRPSASDREAFLDDCARAASGVVARQDVLVYATGIGALFAVTLRARRRLGAHPVILQGPVLWGLEHRWMPRLARAGLAPVIPRLFAWPPFQRDFARRHFVTAPADAAPSGFFDGYARCAATADLFRWCGPAWLRDVERTAARDPGGLDGIEVWWGAHDRVVGPAELRWTERALGVRWPERTFAAWGHYPTIDDPEGWVRAVAATVPARPPVRIAR
jgi:hypothetical protein